MIIHLISCGQMGSDCTGPYRVEMSGPCTVKEFVECVLEQFPNEWGYIGIAKKGEIFGDPNIEYAKGRIITENRLEGVESKPVLKAGAHGGWSRMDYRLDIGEDGVELDKGQGRVNNV